MQKGAWAGIVASLIIGLVVGAAIGRWAGVGHVADRADREMNKMAPMHAGHDMGDASAMNMMMADMSAGLSGLSGDAFDQAFIDEMIVHHEGAVDMARQALGQAKHQEIKDLAKAIIAAQEKEIAQMKAWRTAWYEAR